MNRPVGLVAHLVALPAFFDWRLPTLRVILEPVPKVANCRNMTSRMLWSRILKVVGGIAMLVGTLDPLEGLMLILPGSGMVALGVYLGGKARRTVLYWVWVFILIVVGVGSLFGLSAVGGFGGKSGYSMWWGVLILPYPVGWLMALVGAVLALIRFVSLRRTPVRPVPGGGGEIKDSGDCAGPQAGDRPRRS